PVLGQHSNASFTGIGVSPARNSPCLSRNTRGSRLGSGLAHDGVRLLVLRPNQLEVAPDGLPVAERDGSGLEHRFAELLVLVDLLAILARGGLLLLGSLNRFGIRIAALRFDAFELHLGTGLQLGRLLRGLIAALGEPPLSAALFL